MLAGTINSVQEIIQSGHEQAVDLCDIFWAHICWSLKWNIFFQRLMICLFISLNKGA